MLPAGRAHALAQQGPVPLEPPQQPPEQAAVR